MININHLPLLSGHFHDASENANTLLNNVSIQERMILLVLRKQKSQEHRFRIGRNHTGLLVP